MFNYQLIRSARRKTLMLQVKQGQVFVRAPEFLTLEDIDHFVAQKSCWLKQKITVQQHQCKDHISLFTQGSQLFYLGIKRTLDIKFATQANIQISDDKIELIFSQQKQHKIVARDALVKDALVALVKQTLSTYFKLMIESYLAEKVTEFSNKLQLFPVKYKVRFYKTRWGSCNSRGELSFNYLLMMLPLWVIDYIIVHELCHLQYLNHSPQFWQLVAKYQPNYKKAKMWLKVNQAQLCWQ